MKSFVATVDDEVSVPAGSIVYALYKDTTGQWIYVKRCDGQQGYVPDFICSLLIPTPEDSPLPGQGKLLFFFPTNRLCKLHESNVNI